MKIYHKIFNAIFGSIPNFFQKAIFGLLRFARLTLKKIHNSAGYSSLFLTLPTQKSSRQKPSFLKDIGCRQSINNETNDIGLKADDSPYQLEPRILFDASAPDLVSPTNVEHPTDSTQVDASIDAVTKPAATHDTLSNGQEQPELNAAHSEQYQMEQVKKFQATNTSPVLMSASQITGQEINGQINVIIGPEKGILSVDNKTGQIIYSPKPGYVGLEQFLVNVEGVDLVLKPYSVELSLDNILSTNNLDTLNAIRASNQPVHEVIFVDQAINDYSTLIRDFSTNAVVFTINHAHDGVDQMTEITKILHEINPTQKLNAIHIVSHGTEGVLMLGNSELSSNSINATHSVDLTIIKQSLSDNADLLIYGCNVGAGEAGATFVNDLAQATGADVASSTNDTGASQYGGDWVLEQQYGNIQTASLTAPQWDGLLVNKIINSSGGVAASGADGIRIYSTNDGQLQILYQNQAQLYSPNITNSSSLLYNGLLMSVNNVVIGPAGGVNTMAEVAGVVDFAWKSITQTQSGLGTAVNPFVVTTQMYYDANASNVYEVASDYKVTIVQTYITPNKYFTEAVTVTPKTGNTATIKLYHTLDTYLAGGDNGPAYSLDPNLALNNNTAGNPTFVGVRKGAGTANESIVGFMELPGELEFTRYYSSTFNGMYSSQIDNGGDIINTWNTDPTTDNGIAVQFTLGAITTATTAKYAIAFDGQTSLDLDLNSAGNGFTGTFSIGAGAGTSVVGSTSIDNRLGDINSATITLTNSQAGDLLTIDKSLLPAGIVLDAQTSNVLVLRGIASETAYQDALSLVKFETTSLNLTTRNFNVSVQNQLSSALTTQSSTLQATGAPIVDLNSGTASQTLDSNIIVNGTFSDLADVPYFWTEAGTGATGNNANYGYYQFGSASVSSITQAGLTGLNTGPSGSGGVITFDYAWQDTPLGNNQVVNININGVTYGRVTSSNLSTGTATFAAFNGATIFVSGTKLQNSWNTVTLTLPNTVSANASSLQFENITTTASDLAFIDNISVITRTITFRDQVVGVDYNTTYTENTIPTSIASINATLRSGNSNNIASATINLTNAQIGDRLLVNGSSSANGIVNGQSYTNTGTSITITGIDTLANYQAIIHLISFDNTSEAPVTSVVRDIIATVTDISATTSPQAHSYIMVTGVNDPTIVSNSTAISYTENASPMTINSLITLSDVDNETLSSASVTLSSNFVANQDILGFTNVPATMGNISGSYNASTGILSLSSSGATATIAQWQNALRAVTYSNSSENPNTLTREVTFVVSDGTSNSNAMTSIVDVIAINDRPALSGNTTLTYIENQSPVVIHPAITVIDVDNATLSSASISISANFVVGEDLLNFTNIPTTMGNITGNYNAATGILNLSSSGASATLAEWQAALRAISYQNTSDNPSTLARTVNYVINDGSVDSSPLTATLNITAVNDTPVLSNNSNLNYTENAASAVIHPTITISDLDNTTLSNATIAIVGNFATSEDVLEFVNDSLTMGDINGSFDATTGILSLSSTGAATLAEWQAALQAVTYHNTSDNPNVSLRTISYTVNDGVNNSNSVTATVNITAVNDAPVLTGSNSINYVENDSPTAVFPALIVSDIDNPTLSSAIISITGNFTVNEDVLDFTNNTTTMGDITGNYNSITGVLTLTSSSASATIAEWEAALHAVTYYNTSDNPNTSARTITVVNHDEIDASNTVNAIVNITPVNDTPDTQNLAISAEEDAQSIIIPLSGLDIDSVVVSFYLQNVPENGQLYANNGLTQLVTINTPYNATNNSLNLYFVPDSNWNGVTTFAYVATDSAGLKDATPGTVTITINPVNDAAIISGQITSNVTAGAGGGLDTTTGTLFSSDIDNPDNVFTSIPNPTASINQYGAYTVTNDGYWSYVLDSNNTAVKNLVVGATLTDTIQVTSIDGTPQMITITVNALNHSPVNLIPNTLTTNEDTPLAITGISIDDPDGNLSQTSISVLNGTLHIRANHGSTIVGDNSNAMTITGNQTQINDALATLIYQNNPDYNGTDTLTISSEDNAGTPLLDLDSINITINPAVDAISDTLVTSEDSSAIINPLTNDQFINPAVISSVTQGTHGSVRLNVNGTVIYTPNADFSGQDQFNYIVKNNGADEVGVINVTIHAVTDVQNDTLNTNEDRAATIDVLSNDQFAGAKSLHSVTAGANGQVSFDTNTNLISYAPDNDFNGTDSFTYTVQNGGDLETATVYVNVSPSVDIANDMMITNEDTAVNINVFSNDSFAPTAIISAVTQGHSGTVILDTEGHVTYTPHPDFNGTDSFTYTVLSGNVTETAIVNVTINAVRDTVNDTISTLEDQSVTIKPLANDNFEGHPVIANVTNGTHGRVVVDANNHVTYLPNRDYHGTDSFSYTVTSGTVNETAVIEVTVNPVADTPVFIFQLPTLQPILAGHEINIPIQISQGTDAPIGSQSVLHLVASNIPNGGVLSDGVNTSTSSSTDISSWNIANLTLKLPITQVKDVNLVFQLTNVDGLTSKTIATPLLIKVIPAENSSVLTVMTPMSIETIVDKPSVQDAQQSTIRVAGDISIINSSDQPANLQNPSLAVASYRTHTMQQTNPYIQNSLNNYIIAFKDYAEVNGGDRIKVLDNDVIDANNSKIAFVKEGIKDTNGSLKLVVPEGTWEIIHDQYIRFIPNDPNFSGEVSVLYRVYTDEAQNGSQSVLTVKVTPKNRVSLADGAEIESKQHQQLGSKFTVIGKQFSEAELNQLISSVIPNMDHLSQTLEQFTTYDSHIVSIKQFEHFNFAEQLKHIHTVIQH